MTPDPMQMHQENLLRFTAIETRLTKVETQLSDITILIKGLGSAGLLFVGILVSWFVMHP